MRTAVVIPTIDRLPMLCRCLESLVTMEDRPDGIVVVLQGMEDPAVTAELHAVAPGVTVIWTARRGASIARNMGAAVADADLLLFLDDDCVADRAWFTRYRQAFLADPCLAAASGRVLPLGLVAEQGLRLSVKLGTQPRYFAGRTNPFPYLSSAGNFAVRSAVFRDIGGFDEGLGPGTAFASGEDADLPYRLLAAGYRLAYVPAAVVLHDQWRSPQEAVRINRGYARGTGAFLAKHIRLGDRFAVALAFRLLWRFAVRPLIGGGVTMRKERLRRGFDSLWGILWGMARACAQPLDANARLFHPTGGPPVVERNDERCLRC